MEFIDHPVLLLFIAILSWPVYKTLAKIFFGDYYQDLGECIKYVFQPDWYSLLKGQYWADWDATFKFFFFLGACVGWVASITEIICRIWF